MESANLHQLQDQNPTVEPSSLSTPNSCYGLVGTSHSWTPNITLNVGKLNKNLQEAIPCRPTNNNDIGVPPRPLISGSMTQDSGYHLDLQQFSKIRQLEMSMQLNITPNCSSNMEAYGLLGHHMNNINNIDRHKDMSDKLLLNTIFSGDLYNFGGTSTSTGGVPSTSRGNFSQIYPSINISNLNHSSNNSSPISSSCLDMNPLTSARSYSSHGARDLGLTRFAHDNLSFRLDRHMQHPTHRSSSCSDSSNPSHFTNGTAETKRHCTSTESKASQSLMPAKKLRSESRPSCPPFKVRKEKLGDRIAALQQLVAPFGKTDTASVLMEAIGYIKFLQSQVETLSVPYMKSSQNQTNRVMQGGSAMGNTKGEPKQDLRSRGLCLVPLSCMSYIAGDGSSELWQQPNFGAT